MRIVRAVAVKIVFNCTWIACVNLRTVVYDHVVAHVNARRVQRGRIRFPIGVTAVHIRSGNSRRPRGISLVHTLRRWTPVGLGAHENSKLEFLEKLIIIRKYRLGQIRRYTDWPRPSNPCVAERRASWGENGRAITNNVEKSAAPTFMRRDRTLGESRSLDGPAPDAYLRQTVAL
jgi:hypothetical protein